MNESEFFFLNSRLLILECKKKKKATMDSLENKNEEFILYKEL